MSRFPRAWTFAALAVALAGCAELLPQARNEVASNWGSYEEAKAAIEALQPYRATAADLRAAGIDPYLSPNVRELTYSDVVLRFPISGSAHWEKLDRGLRECLEAGKSCRGYSIASSYVYRQRSGNFWLDALNFTRQTDVTGWNFNALILLVDDRVVYTLHGGQPLIREFEQTKQPLGPLQNWGDTIPGMVK
jgi:hypothetical protein